LRKNPDRRPASKPIGRPVTGTDRFTPLHAKLKRLYPETRCFLRYRTPFQLLCSVILSAQCTDARVNSVAPGLWEKYPTPEKMAKARIPELEKIIQSTGFYHNKAKSLVGCARTLLSDFGGEIPKDIHEFVKVPGVGRKTANVVLGEVFGATQGIAVDTHVARLSVRLGLTREKDPVKIERDLMRIVPKKDWASFSHRLIQHGRKVCDARKPRCGTCALARNCPSAGRIGQAGLAKTLRPQQA
jgi:endonuclease-3